MASPLGTLGCEGAGTGAGKGKAKGRGLGDRAGEGRAEGLRTEWQGLGRQEGMRVGPLHPETRWKEQGRALRRGVSRAF